MSAQALLHALAQGHSLGLPDWGPYSKHYAGISKILRDPAHSMIDFSFVMGYVRGKLIIPDVSFESGYHHWDALADLSYFSYRYELQWRDVEYADVEFFGVDADSALAKITFVNQTDLPKEYVCTLFSAHRTRPHVSFQLSEGERWLDGSAYAALNVSAAAGEDETGPARSVRSGLPMGRDGLRRGVVIRDFLTHHSGLGNHVPAAYTQFQNKDRVADGETFFLFPGTAVTYDVDASSPYGQLYLRYAMSGIETLVLEVQAGGATQRIKLTGWPTPSPLGFSDMELARLDLPGKAAIDRVTIRVEQMRLGGPQPSFILDGMLLTEGKDSAEVARRFARVDQAPRFEVERRSGEEGLALRSTVIPDLQVGMYAEAERAVPPAPYEDCTVTHVYHSDLSGDIQRKLANDSLVNWNAHNVLHWGDGRNHFAGYNLTPIVCPAHAEREIYAAMVCTTVGGALGKVRQLYQQRAEIEQKARAAYERKRYILPSSPYRFSQKMLMTQLCTNVTYPNYIQDGYYVAHTPAKRWGDMAFWDAGMHGIGLLAYSLEKAAALLNQFVVDERHEDVSVVRKGSIFPVHVHLLNEIYQRSGDKALLRYFYPKVWRLYRFYIGKDANAPVGFRDGWLVSEEGGAHGIDDYPAKWHLTQVGQPVISPNKLSHAIRAAKIMRLLAHELGQTGDIEAYSQEIRQMTEVLEGHCWDEESGYYVHLLPGSGEQLTYDGQIHYNMGLDGVSPLVAGTCAPQKRERLIQHLMTPGELWTDYGITAVAMNAPYARRDGYWNGKVWMPYQWFMWKALLGEAELAHAAWIALTAVKVWKHATDETYNCYELFDAATGMGQGAHQFAGLSAPAADFYDAYFTPGRIAVGYDTVIHEARFDPTNCFSCTVSAPYRAGRTGLVVVMKGPGNYRVDVGGQTSTVGSGTGWIDITCHLNEQRTSLRVLPAEGP